MMKTRWMGLAYCLAAFAFHSFAQTVTGSQLQAVSSGNGGGVGGEIDSINTSKTANGTAYRWSLYNMTGPYGNSLQFWDYDTISCSPGGMCSPRLTLLDSGNVGLGTTSPVSRLHLGVGSGDGITIGNPNDPLGNGGTYTIKFYGFRDVTPNVINAKITAERTNACCGWLAQGLDLAFYTTNSNGSGDADNSIERMRIKDSGNVGIGAMNPGAKLEVSGSVKLTAGSGGSITFQDGTTQSTAYTGVICGGDYAESVDVTGSRTSYEPGDVLVIDPNAPGKFLKSAEPYATAVLGVYSTKPGMVGRRQTTPKSADEVPMAMVGIVPTKVSTENGSIKPGDLLVTSSIPGYAMRGTDRPRMLGAVIGKALDKLDSGTGVIEVGVTLQ